MNSKIKTALFAVAALAVTAGVSEAAPNKHAYHGKPAYAAKVVKKHGISPFERAQIARSSANLRALKARAWRDGKLTFAERIMINNAERRHAALVARSYRS